MTAPKKRSLKDVEALVEYMRSQSVQKFTVGDISVEFSVGAFLDTRALPASMDDKENEREDLKRRLKQAVDDEESNLYWSA